MSVIEQEALISQVTNKNLYHYIKALQDNAEDDINIEKFMIRLYNEMAIRILTSH